MLRHQHRKPTATKKNTKTVAKKTKKTHTTATRAYGGPNNRETGSRYCSIVNIPAGTSWQEIRDLNHQNGFNTKVDLEDETFARVKLDIQHQAVQYRDRMNGLAYKGVNLDVRLGRNFASELSRAGQPCFIAFLRIHPSAPTLQWPIVKDSIKQLVPVSSVDELKPNEFKLRFFTPEDYDTFAHSMDQNGGQMSIITGITVPVLHRPWAMKRDHTPRDSI